MKIRQIILISIVLVTTIISSCAFGYSKIEQKEHPLYNINGYKYVCIGDNQNPNFKNQNDRLSYVFTKVGLTPISLSDFSNFSQDDQLKTLFCAYSYSGDASINLLLLNCMLSSYQLGRTEMITHFKTRISANIYSTDHIFELLERDIRKSYTGYNKSISDDNLQRMRSNL